MLVNYASTGSVRRACRWHETAAREQCRFRCPVCHIVSRMEWFGQVLRKHATVYDVVNVHLALLKYTGDLFICRDPSSGALHVSWPCVGLFVAQVSALLLLAIGGQFAHSMLSGTNATYLHHGMTLLMTLTGFFAIVVSVANACAGRALWHILGCFDRFDQKMAAVSAPVDLWFQKRVYFQATAVALVGCVGSNGAFLIYLATTYSSLVLKSIIFVEMTLVLLVVFSTVCQLILITFFAYYRFRHLRRFFALNFLPWSPSVGPFFGELTKVNQQQQRIHPAMFQAVLAMVDDLHRAMQLINRAYAVQVIWSAMSLLPSPTLVLFAIYRSFVTDNYELSVMICIIAVATFLFWMSFAVLILLSSGIHHEVSRLIDSFHHLGTTVQFSRFVLDSAVFLKARVVTIHMGPIELNWKVAFSMVASMVSHLIILIQFDASGPGISGLQERECNK